MKKALLAVITTFAIALPVQAQTRTQLDYLNAVQQNLSYARTMFFPQLWQGYVEAGLQTCQRLDEGITVPQLMMHYRTMQVSSPDTRIIAFATAIAAPQHLCPEYDQAMLQWLLDNRQHNRR